MPPSEMFEGAWSWGQHDIISIGLSPAQKQQQQMEHTQLQRQLKQESHIASNVDAMMRIGLQQQQQQQQFQLQPPPMMTMTNPQMMMTNPQMMMTNPLMMSPLITSPLYNPFLSQIMRGPPAAPPQMNMMFPGVNPLDLPLSASPTAIAPAPQNNLATAKNTSIC